MTGWVNEGRAVHVVYLDFSRAFETGSHNILTGKLGKCGLDEWMVRWIENWLMGRAQRAVIGGWRPVASGVPQGKFWVQSFSRNFTVTWMKGQNVPSASLLVIQNWEEWLTHWKAAAIERDLDRLDNWAERT